MLTSPYAVEIIRDRAIEIERPDWWPSEEEICAALLPGARHIVMEGSHRAIVARGRGRDPVGVLQRMLSLALLDV